MAAATRWIMLLLTCLPLLAWAGPVEVKGVRMWNAPDNTRLVFDVSGPIDHKLFRLENPDRVVVDLSDASLDRSLLNLDYAKSLLHGMRSAPRGKGALRVVLDTRGSVKPKSFVLRPNDRYGHRCGDHRDSEALGQGAGGHQQAGRHFHDHRQPR